MPLVTEVENHGESVWRFSTGTVPSPYGGPDQSEYVEGHGASFDTPGDVQRTVGETFGPFAEMEFTGTFQEGDNISVNWTIRNLDTGYEEIRGAEGDLPYPCDAETAALLFGNFVNGNVDTAGAQGGGKLRLVPAQMPAGTEISMGPPVFTPA